MGGNHSLPKPLYSTGVLHELRRPRARGTREQRECNEALFDKPDGTYSIAVRDRLSGRPRHCSRRKTPLFARACHPATVAPSAVREASGTPGASAGKKGGLS